MSIEAMQAAMRETQHRMNMLLLLNELEGCRPGTSEYAAAQSALIKAIVDGAEDAP